MVMIIFNDKMFIRCFVSEAITVIIPSSIFAVQKSALLVHHTDETKIFREFL